MNVLTLFDGMDRGNNSFSPEKDICRLCSLIQDKLLPIFDNSGSRVDEKIKDCLPALNINQSDGKSQLVCLDCMTKLNMFYEFLHQCIQADKKLENYYESQQASTFKEYTDPHCIWVDGSKMQEPLNVGLQNEGVIVLSKLDSSLNDSSVQDLVVMVELKYKDNLPPTEGSILELSPMKPTSNISEGPSYESLLDMDSLKENGIIDYLGNQNMNINEEKVTKDEKPVKEKVFYNCTYCDRKFNRRTRLNYHLASHTAIRPHKCDQCDKTFAMRWDLNLHQKVHTRTFACELCDKVFITKSKLERHIRVHTGEKPYLCNQCGKSFGEKRNLDNHDRIHTGIRPFNCAICDKTFAIRSHMVEHLNIHQTTAPFECSICSKTFKWRTNYKRHLRLHQEDKKARKFQKTLHPFF